MTTTWPRAPALADAVTSPLAGRSAAGRGAASDGDAYEPWVAGYDVETGEPKGRLRDRRPGGAVRRGRGQRPEDLVAGRRAAPRDRRGVRRGPGPRGRGRSSAGSPSTPPPGSVRGAGRCRCRSSEIEAAVVRHYTSRAGDPHRHLHLQINARVWAAGQWRGLHTVGVRDSLGAINGIGHAAVMCDPEFRAALAAHGLHPRPETGEVAELAAYVGRVQRPGRADRPQRRPLRGRVARRRTPARSPGRELRRAWDARAWAEARPDKVVPRDGAELARRLGRGAAPSSASATRPAASAARPPRRIGALDRDAARRDGADPARGAAVGVERRRHPRRGRAADRRRRRRRRRRGPASSWPRTSPPAPSPRACRC